MRHADFLLGRLNDVRSFTPFDGMLAYSLLGAYEITHEPRFLDAGGQIVSDLLAIPTSQCVLNGGPAWWPWPRRNTGDSPAMHRPIKRPHDIIAQLVPYQNADGSFPHWCPGSRDIHYTGWMAMELIHLGRMVVDPHTAPFLASMSTFLEARIAADGRAIYEEPCPGVPDCTLYYCSRATGCDLRPGQPRLDGRTGPTVACCSIHLGSPKHQPVMTFLELARKRRHDPGSLRYWPPPSDPEYPDHRGHVGGQHERHPLGADHGCDRSTRRGVPRRSGAR